MRHLIAGVLVLGLSASGALADTMQDVIGAQLQAFNDRDVPKAFGYASPMIKRLFGNPLNFGTMVARGYPMVWDNSDVRFLEPREEGPFFFQRVMMRDPNGAVHIIDYKMIREGDTWQIDGVQLLPPAVGA